jgi:hypothetical protein
MGFLEELKLYLKEKEGFDTHFSDFFQKSSGDSIIYIQCICPVHGKCTLRCKFSNIMGKNKLISVMPMLRLSESQFPWDSTVKNVYSIYNGIAGVSGVANRSVNNSLI